MGLNSTQGVKKSSLTEKATTIVVSVIMITYNHEDFIEEAIRSVLMQVCDFEIELLIANDASYDNTDKVVQKILTENSGKRINYIIRDRNIGKTGNFIDALKKSKGKYIALCEGDDYWTDSSKLQKQVDFLEANTNYSMVCHDALVLNLNNTSKQFYLPAMQQQIFSTKFTLRNRHFCATASIVFRKDNLLPYANLQVIPFAGDHLMVQLLSLSGLLFRMRESMSVYRKHRGGVSQIAKPFGIQTLTNKIEALKYFNRVSNYQFSRNVFVEILILKNNISILKTKSSFKLYFLKNSNRLLARINREI
jgi:glycosyltransferase involved in cell wall biosynthesis